MYLSFSLTRCCKDSRGGEKRNRKCYVKVRKGIEIKGEEREGLKMDEIVKLIERNGRTGKERI